MRRVLACVLIVPLVGVLVAGPVARQTTPRFRVPEGWIVEKVAGPPLVRYPLFAAFDDRGRLFVAEGTGTNLPGEDLLKLKKQLGKIMILEDTNGDGVFDRATTFADDLVFPTGVLWHDGKVFATSHPNLWCFSEKDGKAEQREALVSSFRFNGNGCDIHGPFLGPDGRLYWTDGRHGYKVRTREGELLEGLASRIWRCRPDGSQIERLCGGGFDNPVELAFTEAGDLLGTMDQGPGDALLHYVEGAVYPMDHPCVAEFARTGPMLPAVRQFSAALPVALCGMTRLRCDHFGPGYHDTLLTAQFNVHCVQQHTLTSDGATFRSAERDFLTSTDYDTHFTDVLEDADGSVLVVDMGAWFNYGCPTSKIARPEVLGAIYRVRRKDAPKAVDPWGRELRLKTADTGKLVRWLDDARPKVRDAVIEELGRRGKASVPVLAEALVPAAKRSAMARRNAVWALCRVPGPEARAAIRTALGDPDATVRQAAVHAAGLDRDPEAALALAKIVRTDQPRIRLKAAEGLGRIGKPEAVAALFDCLREGTDRFLEHAVIYALLRIADRKALTAGLSDPSPRVRQAVLVALDQMKDGGLAREQLIPLLDTDDQDLQQAVLDVMARRGGSSAEVLTLLRRWLPAVGSSASQDAALTGALLAFGAQPNVQALVSDALADRKTSIAARLLLLRTIGRSRVEPLPKEWKAELGHALHDAEPSLRREAIAVIKARGLAEHDAALDRLASKGALPAELRIAALDCITARQEKLSDAAFGLLTAHLSEKTEPLLRVAAARALGAASLDGKQLVDLAGHLTNAGPMIVPLLAPALARARDAAAAKVFVEALVKAPGALALSLETLDRLLMPLPEQVRAAARPLRDRLVARQKDQAAYLSELTSELLQAPGDAERGKEVFFSRKAACYGCHRATGNGGTVGPDLSQVGRFRTPRDLLESIVFPSSSIVPEFRAFVVQTKDGKSVIGMIARETTDAVYLRTAQLAEVRVARADIEDMAPSKSSIMPEGLEKTMSRQELSDLLEFLYRQR